jgi:hypothetical protein
MNAIPKEAALDMLKHSALKHTNDFAEYWLFYTPSVVVTPNDGSKAFRCSMVDLICFSYDLRKAETELPRHKYTHPDIFIEHFAHNWQKIDWDNPDKIYIDQQYIDQSILRLTLKEALCYAYNLKPNE